MLVKQQMGTVNNILAHLNVLLGADAVAARDFRGTTAIQAALEAVEKVKEELGVCVLEVEKQELLQRIQDTQKLINDIDSKISQVSTPSGENGSK